MTEIEPDFSKIPGGLLTAVVQDDVTSDVLMVAYMNKESWARTLATGTTWFWSRSRQEFWHKGETSGNTQQVTGIQIDCDADTVLIKVIPAGPACHTGARTCFFRDVNLATADKVKEN